MAEVLVDFETAVQYGDATYNARAVGRPAGHMWEGWLEFIPQGGGEPIISGVESTQPERAHLVYWATGLTPTYLSGALARAMKPTTVRVRVVEDPVSTAPAPRSVTRTMVAPGPEAVLDPFEVGGRSLDILRQELGALNRPRLTNIIAAYDLNPAGEDLSWMSDAQLITFIATAVDAQLATARRTR
jgi:hypothetical protein